MHNYQMRKTGGDALERILIIMAVTVVAVALAIGVSLIPVPYVIQSPGPTIDVLGSQGDTVVLELSQSGEGEALAIREAEETDGQLRMVTVSEQGGPGTTVRVGNVVRAFFNPSMTIQRFSDLYDSEVTADDIQQVSAAQMQSSHSAASIAAMEYLGVPMDTTMTVVGTVPGSGSEGVLEEGDVLVSLETPDGIVHPVSSPSVPFTVMKEVPPHSTVTIAVVRDGHEQAMEVVTMSPDQEEDLESREEDEEGEGEGLENEKEDDEETTGGNNAGKDNEKNEEEETENPQGSLLGVFLSADTDLPLNISIHLERVGGPSAGLIFALGIVDRLTEGGITGGEVIAGTGALDFAGNVIPIGGVKQKMYGAVRDGAEWFLVPEANCPGVVGNEPEGLDVIPVATLAEAVGIVEDIAAGDTTDLPSCGGLNP